MSFDGIRESALTQPPLTTVQQPLELAAERALDLLIEGIDSGHSAATTETLPVRLIVRESCGCAAAEKRRAGAPREKWLSPHEPIRATATGTARPDEYPEEDSVEEDH